MSFSMASITVCGRVGSDPKQQSPAAPVKFSVAVDQGFGDKKKTNWYECQIWGKAGEIALQHVSKGQMATVTGRHEVDSYVNKEGVTVRKDCINATDFVSVDLKPRDSQDNQPRDSW